MPTTIYGLVGKRIGENNLLPVHYSCSILELLLTRPQIAVGVAI